MSVESVSSSPVTVDIVDDVLFVGFALSILAERPGSALTVKRVEAGWIPYISTFEDAPDVVIVRDELDDHVPTLLKVRALARIGVRPIVVADGISDARRWRLTHEGAYRAVNRDVPVQELAGMAVETRTPAEVDRPEGCKESRLSDRELQVSALYAGRAAPSSAVLAQLLGIPITSVRTYLQRTRKTLRPIGATSSRLELASVLREQGWI